MNYQEIFEMLWNDYIKISPSAKRIHELFQQKGENVINDHVAFRTFDSSKCNIEQLSKFFIQAGYEEAGQYNFEVKKLFAKHFEHKNDKHAPRVFISQLITNEFSSYLQQTIAKCTEQIPENHFSSAKALTSGRVWETPGYDTYIKLRQESEYAAWLYVYGFRVNHFTVSVNSLETMPQLQLVNEFLKEKGYKLNTSGGEIKGTPEQLLEQSSTLAEIIPVKFRDGVYNIPSCYYEFAKRYKDKSGEIYSGFIAKSADKIFESTNYYK